MATRIAQQTRAAAVGAVVLLDGGTIEIRTGQQPATAGTAASGTLLATLDLPAPAFGGDVTSGVATAEAIDDTTAVASGTAGWFRGYDADGQAVIDGDITDSDGNGAMTLSTLSFIEGGTVRLNGWTITMPAS